MTKIKITISFNENNDICVANDKGIKLTINLNDGTIKASDIFALFDNGIDASYECDEKKIVPEEGQNLNRAELMFNDCLDLVISIVSSVNLKIEEYLKIKDVDDVKEEESE